MTNTTNIIRYEKGNMFFNTAKDLIVLYLKILGLIFVAILIFSIYTGNVHAKNIDVNMSNVTERTTFIDSYYKVVSDEIMKTEGNTINEYITNIIQETSEVIE